MDKGLVEENGIYGSLGVLLNGWKWYLRYFGCAMGLFVKGCGWFL